MIITLNFHDYEEILKSINLKINTERSLHAMLGSEFHKKKITEIITNYSKIITGIPTAKDIIEILNQNFIIAEEISTDKTIMIPINF